MSKNQQNSAQQCWKQKKKTDQMFLSKDYETAWRRENRNI